MLLKEVDFLNDNMDSWINKKVILLMIWDRKKIQLLVYLIGKDDYNNFIVIDLEKKDYSNDKKYIIWWNIFVNGRKKEVNNSFKNSKSINKDER